jgi:hypothetical protein
MRGIWKVNVTRLNRDWFRDGVVMGRAPAVGEEFECETPYGERIRAEVIEFCQVPPKGRVIRMGIYEVIAKEKPAR